MRHGKTAFQNWQIAGCPTIPQKWYPYVIAARYSREQDEKRSQVKAALDEYSKSSKPKVGLLERAAGAISRFFQRRRA